MPDFLLKKKKRTEIQQLLGALDGRHSEFREAKSSLRTSTLFKALCIDSGWPIAQPPDEVGQCPTQNRIDRV